MFEPAWKTLWYLRGRRLNERTKRTLSGNPLQKKRNVNFYIMTTDLRIIKKRLKIKLAIITHNFKYDLDSIETRNRIKNPSVKGKMQCTWSSGRYFWRWIWENGSINYSTSPEWCRNLAILIWWIQKNWLVT